MFVHRFTPTDSRSMMSHLSGEYVTLCFLADLSAAYFLMQTLKCQILHTPHRLVCFFSSSLFWWYMPFFFFPSHLTSFTLHQCHCLLWSIQLGSIALSLELNHQMLMPGMCVCVHVCVLEWTPCSFPQNDSLCSSPTPTAHAALQQWHPNWGPGTFCDAVFRLLGPWHTRLTVNKCQPDFLCSNWPSWWLFGQLSTQNLWRGEKSVWLAVQLGEPEHNKNESH